MTIILAILFLLAAGIAIFLFTKNKKLADDLLRVQSDAQTAAIEAQQSADQRIAAMQQEAYASVAEAQKLIDQQFADMQQESERIRQHYETESRKIQETADALIAKTTNEYEPLRKYEKLRDAETDAQHQLAEALKEATNLRTQAQIWLEQARTFAANERALAIKKAKEIREQAEALLDQATRDAGRIMTEADTIAQQTKKGHVYIISNIGSFGEGVYKIGQTRRPDPQDRIDELSVASVPFEFDIHALIETENAPVLEHKIHKRFLAMQVNKMNARKEFFRVGLTDIRQEIDKLKEGEDFTVKVWTDKAVASEYKESLDIETDPQKKEKWLARQKVMTDRQLKMDMLQLPVSPDVEAHEDDQED